jgi:preprotein translocase subunit SecA
VIKMFKFLSGMLDSNEKELKRLQSYVDRINDLEPDFQKLSDADLRAKTGEFKARISEAASKTQPQLADAQRELDDARECLAKASWELGKGEADKRCQQAQDRIRQVEKETRKLEEEVLGELLPEAFAAVREAAHRTIHQRHFDVQLMGGITLHQGKIAEMKTGEGKTLVATLPLYLNSLTGRGCHLATVNDYLARRDAYWMGAVFQALGVNVSSIYPMQNPSEQAPARLFDPAYDSGVENDQWRHFRPVTRKEAYKADITYGTSAEFGFDYLRDNMVLDMANCVQRPVNYAIVDEVDNLLIDEARTPLIISAPDVQAGQLYQVFAQLVLRLKRGEDYEVKEKERSAEPTEAGWDNVERMVRHEGLIKSGSSLYDSAHLMHHLRNALSAKEFYKKDQQYVVERGKDKTEVIIVDEFTGRKMFGRRYSEGLHQAIEAKEHIKVAEETLTYATITIQNYFRMYAKLAGMTGTAATEAEEFYKIYKLEVTAIPTNKPMVREDFPDQIYKNEDAKYKAVVREIKQLHEQERPVLVGTVSIEKSEYLRDMLKRQGVTCQVLNAKEHLKEAEIIKKAGEPGAVTVATNMAGRGVDIILGGSPDGLSEAEVQVRHNKVIGLGGLHIIGTERHEARRIDNQLRGRAGRQGDPGSSRFFLSLEDDMMRRFGGDRIKTVMGWAGMDEETPIENKLITNAITDVQKRVEGYHFDVRKQLVEFDDVVNKHRELIYQERLKILSNVELKTNILSMVAEEISGMVAAHPADPQQDIGMDIAGLLTEVAAIFPLPASINAAALSGLKPRQIEDKLIEISQAAYDAKEKELGQFMRQWERRVMLNVIDRLWIEHLTMMEHMRLEAGWQTLRQTRPVDAYKSQGFQQFQTLLETIKHDVTRIVYHVELKKQENAPAAESSPMAQVAVQSGKQARTGNDKVGRNEPCPCGSGKKYKHCCGK